MVYKRLHKNIHIVGDDLTVTNPERIQQAVDQQVISAAILKPNQIGTYTETLAAWKTLQDTGRTAMISHRSGETTDTSIADLAVGWNVPMIKAGAPSRGERVAKYNRLLEIERELGASAVYPGNKILIRKVADAAS